MLFDSRQGACVRIPALLLSTYIQTLCNQAVVAYELKVVAQNMRECAHQGSPVHSYDAHTAASEPGTCACLHAQIEVTSRH